MPSSTETGHFLYAVDCHDVAVSTQRLGSADSVPVPAQPFKFLTATLPIHRLLFHYHLR